ncbi:FkbM family methyltransferase [Limnobacter litoralis]|uniref:Methyltransferase FkbM domain-containing protein n=1 Tax=Limnobacter litoralis TaxID=481366 RepID=A0ABQ5YRU3_9BURK|nr:FkbM family methyltransferase [Limnobacter litoralis]GLR26167.1 hypothetical protein GCM10007875_12550 [Limnobacter litoralis]
MSPLDASSMVDFIRPENQDSTMFLEAADSALQARMCAKVDLFVNPAIRMPRYLVGRNADALHVSRVLPIQGVIDDTPNAPATWEGLPVVKMDQIPAEAWVLNCATSIAPVNVEQALMNVNVAQRLHLGHLAAYAGWINQQLPWFVAQQREDFSQHRGEWAELFERLEDVESKRVLQEVVCYRLTADPTFMQRHLVRLSEQYFECFLNLKGEVFVDAGGFDGDTTALFIQHDPDHRQIYFVEPSPINMTAAQVRLASTSARLQWLPVGLSSEAGELRFNAGEGSASAVGHSGDTCIHVDTLDSLVAEPVSFIKMDLEGWELHALAGCRRHIEQDRPKLAIAVYHDASHFREVARVVLGWNPHYKVRLRHYTQGWSETVMFFSDC